IRSVFAAFILSPLFPLRQPSSFPRRLSQARRAGTIAATKASEPKERDMPKTPDYFAGKTICKTPFHSVHIVLKTVEFSRVKRMDAVEHGYDPQGGFSWLVSSSDLPKRRFVRLPRSACTTMAPVSICKLNRVGRSPGFTDID